MSLNFAADNHLMNYLCSPQVLIRLLPRSPSRPARAAARLARTSCLLSSLAAGFIRRQPPTPPHRVSATARRGLLSPPSGIFRGALLRIFSLGKAPSM